jgi:hypothetical protein
LIRRELLSHSTLDSAKMRRLFDSVNWRFILSPGAQMAKPRPSVDPQ